MHLDVYTPLELNYLLRQNPLASISRDGRLSGIVL